MTQPTFESEPTPGLQPDERNLALLAHLGALAGYVVGMGPRGVPLVIGGLPRDVAGELVDRHLRNRNQFWTRYPVPSVAASEPSFDPRSSSLIWRGPTWVNTNWLLWRGLRRHGFDELASQLAARTITMVADAGLREFYNPLNGEGNGARSFGWSALALDMAEG